MGGGVAEQARVFATALPNQPTYTIPPPPPPPAPRPTSSSAVRVPVFLGPDGTLYDVHYVPFPIEEWRLLLATLQGGNSAAAAEEADPVEDTSSKARSITEVVPPRRWPPVRHPSAAPPTSKPAAPPPKPTLTPHEEELVRASLRPDHTLFQSLPPPEDYRNFYEYEAALLEWKAKADEALGFLQLPRPMGRHYCRPRVEQSTTTPQHKHPPSKESDEMEFRGTPVVSASMNVGDWSLQDGDAEEPSLAPVKEWMDEEPWHQQLVPAEPEPNFYATFEDYEEALVRWGNVCFKTLSVIPPHAKDFVELLNLNPVKELELNKTVPTTADKGVKPQAGVAVSPSHVAVVQVQNAWNDLRENVREQLSQKIEEVKERLHVDPEAMTANVPSVVPRIHGVFAKGGKGTPSDASKSARPRGITPAFSPSPLAERDGTVDLSQYHEFYDCEETVDGQPVLFELPAMDLEPKDVFSIEKALLDPKLMQKLRAKVQLLNFAGRFDDLESWYHPSVPAQTLEEHDKAMDILMNPDTLTAQALRAMMYSDMYLDQFQKRLADSTAFLSLVTPEMFAETIALFDESASRAVHAKVSVFVKQVLRSLRAKDVMNALVGGMDSRPDFNSLYHITQAIPWLEDVPVDIFRYTMTYQHLPQSTFRGEWGVLAQEMVDLTVLRYYLDHIGKFYGDSYLMAPEINEVFKVVQNRHKDTLNAILDRLRGKSDFLQCIVWDGVGHKIPSVSFLFLFVLIQLMKASKDIQNVLRAPEVDLVGKVRALAHATHETPRGPMKRRLKHVEFAISRLWKALQSEAWLDTLESQYDGSFITADITDYRSTVELKPAASLDPCTLPSRVVVDRGTPPRKRSPLHFAEDARLVVFRSSIHPAGSLASVPYPVAVRQFLFAEMQKATPTNLGPIGTRLIEARVFHALLSKILDYKQKLTENHVFLAKMFAVLCQTLQRMGRLKAVSPEDFKTKRSMQRLDATSIDLQVMVQYKDVASIYQAIASIKSEHYELRKHLLTSLKHLLKIRSIYVLVWKEQAFLSELVKSCRDVGDIDFNREAWRQFYQLFRYHPSTLEHWADIKFLWQFLELIGSMMTTSRGGIVLAVNSIHYINKILLSVANENQRSEEKKSMAPVDARKTHEKGQKFLADQLHNFFIRFHMMLRRFELDERYGAAFQKLAKLFLIINSTSACKKLCQEAVKNSEYKGGLERMATMYGRLGDVFNDGGGAQGQVKSATGFKRFMGKKFS